MRGDSEGDEGFLPSLGTRGLLLCCREIVSSASGLLVPARLAACNAAFPRAGGGTFVLEVPSLLPKMFSGPMTDFSYCSRFWGRSTWRTTLGDFIAWRKTSWALEGVNERRMTLCSGARLAEAQMWDWKGSLVSKDRRWRDYRCSMTRCLPPSHQGASSTRATQAWWLCIILHLILLNNHIK